jgi:hypothetical protein
VEVGVVPHWLAVNGVQPAIPENAALEPPRPKRRRAERGAADDGAAVSQGKPGPASGHPIGSKRPVLRAI